MTQSEIDLFGRNFKAQLEIDLFGRDFKSVKCIKISFNKVVQQTFMGNAWIYNLLVKVC